MMKKSTATDRIIYKTHHLGAMDIITCEKTKGIFSTKFSGIFPVTSTHGNSYVFVMYDYESYTILAETIKNLNL